MIAEVSRSGLNSTSTSTVRPAGARPASVESAPFVEVAMNSWEPSRSTVAPEADVRNTTGTSPSRSAISACSRPAAASTSSTSKGAGRAAARRSAAGPITRTGMVITSKLAAYPKTTSMRIGRTIIIASVRRSRRS